MTLRFNPTQENRMKRSLFTFIVALLSLSSQYQAHGQGSELYGSGMKIKLSDDGSKFIRFVTWHQVWTHFSENNTGSMRLNNPAESTLDFGIRRSRMLIHSQLSPRFLILTHFGINNQSAVAGGYNATADGKKPQLFVHDAWGEYKVSTGNQLYIGAGLHYWNGITRMNSASTLNFLGVDAPIFNWPNIDAADQFARYLGVYAKGQLGRLDYRISANDPFATNTAGALDSIRAQYNPRNISKMYQGYFQYFFKDKEANVLPFTVGSYLGSKNVFNVGAGFLTIQDAMWIKQGADTVYQAQNLFGLDVFYDHPLNKEKGTAVTFYGAWMNYNFGKDYVRFIGILNPATGSSALRGNASPLIGTGNILFGQLGYLLPKSFLGSKCRVQPYVEFSHLRLEGLKDASGSMVPVSIFDAGANFFLEGHHAKITINYKNRPDVTNVNDVKSRSEVVIQAMVYL